MYENKDIYIYILEILETYLLTHDYQFGFKAKHSTDMCIFTVKTLIKYYTDQNTPVYTCLLDASKAFDRVNHWTLFAKLIESHIYIYIYINNLLTLEDLELMVTII